jgi:hypothetical protein
VQRRAIAFMLEDAWCCGLAPGNPQLGLAIGRGIFQRALMTGRAPETPAVDVAPVATILDIVQGSEVLVPPGSPASSAATPAGDRLDQFVANLATADPPRVPPAEAASAPLAVPAPAPEVSNGNPSRSSSRADRPITPGARDAGRL